MKTHGWCRTCGSKFRRTFRRRTRKYCSTKCRPSNRKVDRLQSFLTNIRNRCANPKIHGYERYGGRGIQCQLTLKDLRRLWRRDCGSRLEKPSIDRIDNDGHYEYRNCRFIELSDNVRRRTIPDNLIPGIRSWLRKRKQLYSGYAEAA